jgi:hypothetical protein
LIILLILGLMTVFFLSACLDTGQTGSSATSGASITPGQITVPIQINGSDTR